MVFIPLTLTNSLGCDTTHVFELSEPTTLSLTTSDLKDISCFGLTDGLVELEAQGIQGGSNYSITHQSTNITNNEILYQFTNAGQNG